MNPITIRLKRAYRTPSRERGAFALMVPAVLMVILGFCALALDLGQAYNRETELQGIALAAARGLNGTAAGVTAPLLKAGETASRLKVRYGQRFAWDDAALRFSNTPASGAEWVDGASARSAPADRYYVKVDTGALGPDLGLVETLLIGVLPRAQASASMAERAMAGRSTLHVLPLAICAMSGERAAARTNPGPPQTVELVEYGFRRGVGYDLMQLNPGGQSDQLRHRNVKIDYLALVRDPGGSLALQPISPAALPTCPRNNRETCMLDPHAANCLRFVRARICADSVSAGCSPAPFQTFVPFVPLPLAVPKAVPLRPTESFGSMPEGTPCSVRVDPPQHGGQHGEVPQPPEGMAPVAAQDLAQGLPPGRPDGKRGPDQQASPEGPVRPQQRAADGSSPPARRPRRRCFPCRALAW